MALPLLDHLAEPQLAYQPSFAAATGTRIEIRLRGQEYELREAWEKIFRPNITDAAPDVIVIADHYLRRIWQLLSAGEAARPGWDPVSFSRSAIEPHPQDDMPEPADILIDAARDCLNALVDSDKTLAGPTCRSGLTRMCHCSAGWPCTGGPGARM